MPLSVALDAIVQLGNAAATRACRGGRIPGDPQPCSSPPPPGVASEKSMSALSVCREITVTLLNFTSTFVAEGPLIDIQTLKICEMVFADHVLKDGRI